jgi:DNA-binding HxlR family transcriptional regulator
MSPRCRSCTPVPAEVRRAAELLERRWSLATVYACRSGAARFNEFLQALPGISPSTLSERLEQLEAADVIERNLSPGRPPHSEYRLTRKGHRLAEVVEALGAWSRTGR